MWLLEELECQNSHKADLIFTVTDDSLWTHSDRTIQACRPRCPGPSPGSVGPRGWAGCSSACSRCVLAAPSSRWSPLWPGRATGSRAGPCTPAKDGRKHLYKVINHNLPTWRKFDLTLIFHFLQTFGAPSQDLKTPTPFQTAERSFES